MIEEPGYFYHATYESNAASIKAEGFKKHISNFAPNISATMYFSGPKTSTELNDNGEKIVTTDNQILFRVHKRFLQNAAVSQSGNILRSNIAVIPENIEQWNETSKTFNPI